MVVFTCSQCGESVKKTAVAKHYQIKCRARPMLTCVDCLKDFNHVEYEAHTKCVTEEERYAAKGFVAKASSNKGEKKQKSWSECIHELLDSGNLKTDEQELLSLLVKYDNIPRKKPKFNNFMKSAFSYHFKKTNLIERVWNLMEANFKEKIEKTNGEAGRIATEAAAGESGEQGKAKKRERERENGEENVEADGTERKKKKKKKKHFEIKVEEGDKEEANKAHDSAEIKQEKDSEVKTNSKKRQREKAEANENNLQKSNGEKKKKENACENVNNEMEENPVTGIKKNKKKKKRKSKPSQEEETQVMTNGSDEKILNGDNSVKFNWSSVILDFMSTNEKMSLKKLEKKVLKCYSKVEKVEITEKVRKKFLKRLNKTEGVVLQGEQVIKS